MLPRETANLAKFETGIVLKVLHTLDTGSSTSSLLEVANIYRLRYLCTRVTLKFPTFGKHFSSVQGAFHIQRYSCGLLKRLNTALENLLNPTQNLSTISSSVMLGIIREMLRYSTR